VIDEKTDQFGGALRQSLQGPMSRARLLAGVGAGVALAAVPSVAGAQTPATETVQDIINIADTAEHLAVTLLYGAVQNASTLGLNGLVLDVVQAALAEEQYHADFLEAAGAKTLTDTFNVPDPKILTDFTTFFTTVETLEAAFIAAYMRASYEFSVMGNAQLAQYAMEIGGVEAEHRTLARAALALAGTDNDPPNNLAFESDLFTSVADAAKALEMLGFIGGSGPAVTYPGRSAALSAAGAMATAVTNQTPQKPGGSS
jgi:hypothetical protein